MARLPAARSALSAALYLTLAVCTVAQAVVGLPADLGPLAYGLFAFLALELAAASRLIAASAALLIGLGLLAGGAAPLALLVEAAVRTLPFLVLFLAVLCLQGPALNSPSLRAVGGFVGAQPPGRRFLGIALAGHLLGAVLNVAGLLLVLSLRDPGQAPADRLRLAAGAMRGFGAAATWSPLFVAMSVVLAVLPGLSWLDIAWRSALTALAVIALAWLWNRIERGRAATAAGLAPRLAPAVALRTAFILASLLVPVVVLFEAYGLAIPIALGLVAPAVAVLWQAAQSPPARRWAETGRRAAAVFAGLSGLRNEALLFFAANAFGLGLAQGLDAATLARLAALLPGAAATLAALVMGGLVLAGLGVHPIVVVVAVGSVLTPEVLGLSELEVALALLVVWGLGAIMSPFSGTVLQVARLTNVSPFAVAWRWNARFCLAVGLPVSLVVYAVARLS